MDELTFLSICQPVSDVAFNSWLLYSLFKFWQVTFDFELIEQSFLPSPTALMPTDKPWARLHLRVLSIQPCAACMSWI